MLFERGRRHSLDKVCDDGLDVIVKKSVTLTSKDIQTDDKIEVKFDLSDNEKSYISYINDKLAQDLLYMVISMKLIKT